MAKTKKKTRSEIEHLKGIIRQLKAELRQYKNGKVDDVEEIDDSDEGDCPSCGKFLLRELNLSFVKYNVCDICGYKEKIE